MQESAQAATPTAPISTDKCEKCTILKPHIIAPSPMLLYARNSTSSHTLVSPTVVSGCWVVYSTTMESAAASPIHGHQRLDFATQPTGLSPWFLVCIYRWIYLCCGLISAHIAHASPRKYTALHDISRNYKITPLGRIGLIFVANGCQNRVPEVILGL